MSTTFSNLNNLSGLHRSATDRKFKGVCGGLAQRYGWDATVVRIAFVLGTIFLANVVSGWFIFSYFIAALVMKDRPAPTTAPYIVTVTEDDLRA